jgi:hypothetical protein
MQTEVFGPDGGRDVQDEDDVCRTSSTLIRQFGCRLGADPQGEQEEEEEKKSSGYCCAHALLKPKTVMNAFIDMNVETRLQSFKIDFLNISPLISESNTL